MDKIKIIVDSAGDFTKNEIIKYNFGFCKMSYTINDISYIDDPCSPVLSNKQFYDLLREKNISKTAQVTTSEFMSCGEQYIKEGYSLIYLTFSSALSGTHNSACLAKNMLLETYPDAKIVVIDSLCAALGQAYYSILVARFAEKNPNFEQVVEYAEYIKLRVVHIFTVDDIGVLERGGRLTATKAFVAKTLSLKPCLRVDEQGRLVSFNVSHGRTKAIKDLINETKKSISMINKKIESEVIWIGHADDLEDALKVETLLRKTFKSIELPPIEIHEIGPIIGSHVGPGMLSIFFLAKDRSIK
ncbi:MAG: DegV family protein [Bacilli bacterium]